MIRIKYRTESVGLEKTGVRIKQVYLTESVWVGNMKTVPDSYNEVYVLAGVRLSTVPTRERGEKAWGDGARALPIVGYTERLRPKGVLFCASNIQKGRDIFCSLFVHIRAIRVGTFFVRYLFTFERLPAVKARDDLLFSAYF